MEEKRKVSIISYSNYDDAILGLSLILDADIDNGYTDIKGEIQLIDGKWRVGTIVNSRQMELDV